MAINFATRYYYSEVEILFTIVLYGTVIILLAISYLKNQSNTKAALKKAWKAFENILPQFLSVLLIIGIILSLLNRQTISELIGVESGFKGLFIAAIIGSVTLIPGFVAFPLAASLLHAGAGYGQITMFVTTLMMVGIITLPVEVKYFGRKVAVLRNLLAFAYAIAASLLIGGFFV